MKCFMSGCDSQAPWLMPLDEAVKSFLTARVPDETDNRVLLPVCPLHMEHAHDAGVPNEVITLIPERPTQEAAE